MNYLNGGSRVDFDAADRSTQHLRTNDTTHMLGTREVQSRMAQHIISEMPVWPKCGHDGETTDIYSEIARSFHS